MLKCVGPQKISAPHSSLTRRTLHFWNFLACSTPIQKSRSGDNCTCPSVPKEPSPLWFLSIDTEGTIKIMKTLPAENCQEVRQSLFLQGMPSDMNFSKTREQSQHFQGQSQHQCLDGCLLLRPSLLMSSKMPSPNNLPRGKKLAYFSLSSSFIPFMTLTTTCNSFFSCFGSVLLRDCELHDDRDRVCCVHHWIPQGLCKYLAHNTL